MRIRATLSLVAGLACNAVNPSSSTASAVTWEPDETVDQSVTEISSTSGRSAALINDWHVVYCRDGQVMLRVRGSTGWLPVETVSTAPGTARNPHLAWAFTTLFVVWEDDRTGIPEVWLRTREGGVWSAEICLTEDSIPSRSPSIAASELPYQPNDALLVWQEGENPTQIRARHYEGSWSESMPVSLGSGSGSEPSAIRVGYAYDFSHCVVWSDTRHGAAEIYMRPWIDWNQSWGEEQRLTDLPGDCLHPSITAGFCCGDILGYWCDVVFEHAAHPTPVAGRPRSAWANLPVRSGFGSSTFTAGRSDPSRPPRGAAERPGSTGTSGTTEAERWPPGCTWRPPPGPAPAPATTSRRGGRC